MTNWLRLGKSGVSRQTASTERTGKRKMLFRLPCLLIFFMAVMTTVGQHIPCHGEYAMKVALLSGFILALPIIAYEIVAFIVPGLEPREKRWLFISLPFIVILFVAGVAFTYFVMLKAAIPFLVNFLGVQTVPRLSNYVGFVTNLMFWIGLSFESPLVVLLLAKLKLVNARMLLKGWRVAIIVSAVLAAIITPTTDPVNMGLLMAPLMGLYLISIFLAYLVR